jgi:hypothetical protein
MAGARRREYFTEFFEVKVERVRVRGIGSIKIIQIESGVLQWQKSKLVPSPLMGEG